MAEAQAQAEAEENGFPIYTQESNYDDSGSTDWDYDSGSYEEDPEIIMITRNSSGDGSAMVPGMVLQTRILPITEMALIAVTVLIAMIILILPIIPGDGDQIDYPDESTDTSGDDTSEDFSYQDTAPSDPGQE